MVQVLLHGYAFFFEMTTNIEMQPKTTYFDVKFDNLHPIGNNCANECLI